MKIILQNNEEDCLLACYTMLLNDLGHKIPLYEVFDRDMIPADGLNVSYLLSLNKRFMVKTKAYHANFKELLDLYSSQKCRMILHWNHEHFVVLEKITSNSVTIIDPAIGRVKLNFDDFCSNFSETIILMDRDSEFKPLKVKDLFWKYFKKTIKLKHSLFLIIALLISQLSVLLFAISMRNMMSDGKSIYGVIIIVGVLFFQIVSFTIKNKTLESYNKTFDKYYTHSLFEKLLEKPLLYFRNHTNGSIVEKINFKTNLRDSVSQKLIPSIIGLFSGIMIYLYLMTISIELAGVLFVIISIYVLFSILLCKRQNEVNQTYLQSLIEFNSEFQSDLEMIDYVKIMRKEKNVENNWELYNDKLTYQYSKVLQNDNLAQLIATLFNYLSLAVIVILVVYYNKYFKISVADLVLYQTSISLLISSVEQIKSSVFELARLTVYAEKQGDILKDSKPVYIEESEQQYLIKAQKLNFAYGQDSLYEDIDLEILQGEKIAILGKSGSGKSTLMLLLTGMLRYKGKLKYGIKDLSSNLGVVLQNMTLRKGTIVDNLSAKDVAPDELNKILIDSTANTVVHSMPRELNSKLLKQGKNLSGGQIQKLLIARSLIEGKKMIVWDEAFSNLDEISKNQIYQNVLKSDFYKGKTMLIVSHHLDIVNYVDSIIFIDDSTKTVYKGSHEEMLRTNLAYRNFIHS